MDDLKSPEHYQAMRQESQERCDTDGFASQQAFLDMDLVARLQRQIDQYDGKAQFWGLYQGTRRIKARLIEDGFGKLCWHIHKDEQELIKARGKAFIPQGVRSRVQKQLGLTEHIEWASAKALLKSNHEGITWASYQRTGCVYGLDAKMDPDLTQIDM